MRKCRIIIFSVFIIFISYQGDIGRLFAKEQSGNQAPAPQQPAGQQPPTPQQTPQGGEQQKQQQPAAQDGQDKKSLTAPAPVMEIKRLESEEPLYSIELRDVSLVDLFRVIAHDYDLNIVVDKDVSGTITASFTNISLEEALDGIAELSNLTIQKKGNIFRVSPNLITRTIALKYIEAKKLLQGGPSQSGGAAASGSSSSQGAGGQASTIYDLISAQGKVLMGDQPNSIIVIDYPTNVKKVEDFVKVIDQRMTSRVFKLKYMKATDVVGQAATIVPPATGGSATGTSSGASSGSSSGSASPTTGSSGGG